MTEDNKDVTSSIPEDVQIMLLTHSGPMGSGKFEK